MTNLTKIHGHRLRIFSILAVLISLLFSQAVPFALAATSPWSQTDWSGGSGQTNWSTTNRYDSGSSVTTSTANQVTLTPSEKLTNRDFETDLTGWTGSSSGFSDNNFANTSGAVAAWPLDDSTSTQSYARVVNPALSTGKNIVLNGTFADTSNWSLDAPWTITGGVLHGDGTGSGNNAVQNSSVFLQGKAYQVSYTISNYVSGAVFVRIGSSGSGTSRNANGTYTETFIAASGTAQVGFHANTAFVGDIDNVSVTQLNIPAYDATPSQILTDGNMESAGTSSWTANANTTLSKQTGSPHAGSQILRVTNNGSGSSSFASQAVITSGVLYRVTGYARSDGGRTPVVLNNTTLWTGTTSTNWQPFDLTFIGSSSSTSISLGALSMSTNQYVEFDDVVVSLDTGIRADDIMSTQDGNMEDTTTNFWVAGSSGVITKDTTNPHGGSRNLRLAYGGVANPTAVVQSNAQIGIKGKTYRITGWFRGDGASALPRILQYSSGTTLVSGTTSNTWQFFDVNLIADNTPLFTLRTVASSTGYAEFDDISVTELDPLIGLPANGAVPGGSANGHLTKAYTFDGTNDAVNIYSSDLNSAFNQNEGTMIVWAKVASAGVWTDATVRYLGLLRVDASNKVELFKTATNNQLTIRYVANGTTSGVNVTTAAPTGWFQTAITWSKTNDQVKVYVNGAQQGSTVTSLGTWTGSLLSTSTVIGAGSSSGSTPWSGMINDVRVYNRALTSTEISDQYTGSTATRDTGTKHAGLASAKIVSGGDVGTFVQSVNVNDTNTYTLSAYAYTDGSAVTSSDLSLLYNGSIITTNYSSVGGGWYRLTGTITGLASSVSAGVQVQSGKTVYIDDVSLSNYPASGTLTSSIFDVGQGSNWGTLTFVATTPTNTTATVKVRAGNQSDLSDASAFGSCTAINSGVTVGGTSCAANGKRYVQYLITLATTDLTVTPTFTSFSLPFTTSDATAPDLSLTALSPDPNTDNTPTLLGTATESIGTVTAVQFQMDSTSGVWSACTASDGSFNSATENFSCTPTTLTDGSHTMYVRSTDSNGNTTSSNFPNDSFTIDTVAPLSVSIDSPADNSFTNSERPTFKWKTTTDATSGIAKYVLDIDNASVANQPSGDFTIDNIPTTRTSDFETNKYVIHYENFSDSDQTNNYISVTTKSSSEWGANDLDGKLREGKAHFTVKAVDNAGNTVSSSHTLFVDRSSPSADFTQINALPFSTNTFSTSDTTPTVYGKLSDGLNAAVSSGPNQVDIKVEKKSGLLYSLVSLTTIHTNESWYMCDSSKVVDTIEQRCGRYVPFEFTPKESLTQGEYKISLSGKDNADNTSGQTILYLSIKNASDIVVSKPVVTAIPSTPLPTVVPTSTPIPKKTSITPSPHPTSTPTSNVVPTSEPEVTKPEEPRGPGIVERVGNGVANILSFLVGGIGHGLSSVGSGIASVGNGIGGAYTSFANGTPKFVRGMMLALGNGTHTVTSSIARGIASVAYSLSASIESIAYRFDKSPTRISNVEVVALSPTSVKILWKTNHPATGKVNYGLDETYPLDIQSDEKVTDHEFVLEDLQPNTQYSFEVMSQNRNYVYDANRKFTTPAK